MSLPRYPQYKDSGVVWLDDVPAHWRISPLKHLVSMKSGGTPSKDNLDYWDGEVPWASAKDLKTDMLADTIDHITSFAVESGNADLVPAGTILVVVRGMILARAFPVAEVIVPMAINQDLKGIVPRKDLLGRFLAWLLRGTAEESLLRLDEAGHGTKALRMDAWTSMQVPVPPIEEQSAIAAFLDSETGKIDALIAEQEKLLTVLAEKRQATISHAITRGLNQGVQMKDSGVAWLGEVPAHWEVKRLKHLGDAIIGLTYDPSEVTDEDNGTLVLRSSNVQQGQITFEDNVFVSSDIPEKLRTIEGDILICSRNGSRALIGKNAVITKRAEGLTFGAFMTVFRSQFNDYLRWVFNSQIFSYQSGSFLTSTINQLTTGNLYGFEVPVPGTDERAAIAAFLDEETAKLDRLKTEAERAIKLLKERRGTLIAAAVTGKIDVRNTVLRELAA